MRLVAVITNCRTGRAEYPEYGKSDFEKAVAASATVPYVSRPVIIDGTPYLDGGCADRIPYQWALNEGYEKIVIVRTRDLQYRKKEKSGQAINALMYRKYPAFRQSLDLAGEKYNRLLERIDTDSSWGKVFVQAPVNPVAIGRFEGNMEKLGELYWTG